MATCTKVLPNAVLEDGTLNVVSKFTTLSEEALGTNSIYMRAKDTFKELFDGKKVNESEYAQLASSFVSQLAVATTQYVMQGAIQWASQEKELAYSLALQRANVELALAGREKVGADICLAEKDLELKCAQLTATIAGSIRDNGRVLTYTKDAQGVDTCVPATLWDEGVKYDQKAVYQAQTYTALADAYRKSGNVQIGLDIDLVTKGLSGDNVGYTDAQEEYARRQILSFEDSKRNHAANAMSAMIGQMLSAEVAPKAEDVSRWRSAIDYLNTNTITSIDSSYIVSQNSLALFTNVLDTVAPTSKDTTAEIVALQSICDRIVSTAAMAYVYPALTETDFTTIGITGVTSLNLSKVITHISATDKLGDDVNTVAKVQAEVTLAIV